MRVGSAPSRAETSRRNGRASKGPRSALCKARSAMNATRHGLTAEAAVLALVGETAADWSAHRAGIVAALSPVGALEDELAERVASLTWRLRRVVRAETATLADQLEDAERRAVRDGEEGPSARESCAPGGGWGGGGVEEKRGKER